MTLFVFLVVALAAYRLTRLLVTDTILDRPRNWLFTHAPAKIGELLDCPHCLGVWVGAGCTLLVLLARYNGPWILMPFAAAGIVSLLAHYDGR